MSREVDQRVVEMQFDNSKFEKNVQTSVDTINKLKQSLNLQKSADEANKSISKVEKSMSNMANFSFDALMNSVSAIERRFSAFGIVGMRVLQNLTDSAMKFVNKGLSFIYQGIVGGGVRRATNIENAHFQLQGLLKDEEKVQAVMDDAMWSVDGTAYAYDEAAKAASMFAASGLKAGDQMKTALRAITGVAATTNSDYEGIANIFTTVAGNGRIMGEQLLSLSTRGLNAAATLSEFFNKVNEGSIDASDNVEALIKEITGGAKVGEADIRGFVSDGVVSFDIFAEAMDTTFGEHAKKANETFNGALSNVKAALARIGAEFVSPLIVQNGPFVRLFNALRVRTNEIKANIGPLATFFTENVAKIINSLSEFIENVDLTKPIESFYNVFDSIRNIAGLLKKALSPIGRAFGDIFDRLKPDDVLGFTEAVKNFTSQLTISEKTLNNVRRTFRGVFAVVDILKIAFKEAATWIVGLIRPLLPATSKFWEFTGSIGDFLVKVDESAKKTGVLRKVLEKLTTYIEKAVHGIRVAIEWLKESFQKFNSFPWVKALGQALKNVWNRVKQLVGAFSGFFDFVKWGFTTIAKTIDTSRLLEIVKTVAGGIRKVVSAVSSFVGKSLSGIFEKLGQGDFKGALDTLNAFVSALMSMRFMSFVNNIDWATFRLSYFGTTTRKILYNAKWDLINFGKQIQAQALLKIAGAIFVLASAMAIMSTIDAEKLAQTVGVTTVLLSELVGILKMFDTFDVGKSPLMTLAKGEMLSLLGTALRKFATSLLILAFAMKLIADMEWEEIAKGLVGVAGLAIILTGVMFAMSKMGRKAKKSAGGLIMLAIALRILVPVCKELAELSWQQIGKALSAIGGLLTELALFSRFAKQSKRSAVGLLIVVASLRMLIPVIQYFADMPIPNVKNSLSMLAILLSELSAFMAVSAATKGRGAVKTGVGLILLASSLGIVTAVIGKMAKIGWGGVKQGLSMTAIALAEFAAGLNAMKGTLRASVALTIATVALGGLVAILKALATMSLTEVFTGLIAIAGLFTTLGIAAYALKPVSGTLLVLSGTLIVFGAGLTLVGVGLVAIGAGLTSISVGLAAFAGQLVATAAAIPQIIKIIFKSIVGAFIVVLKQIKDIAIALLDIIIDLAPKIAETVVTVVKAIGDVLLTTVPELAGVIFGVIDGLLEEANKYVGPIVDKICVLLITVMDTLKSRIPELVTSAMGLLGAFGQAFSNAVSSIGPGAIVSFFASLLYLSAIFKMLAGMKKDAVKSLATIGVMLVLLAGVGGVLYLLKDMDGLNTILTVTAISEAMLALAGVIAILQGVPVKGALTAVADLDIMVANLALVLTALGAIYEIPHVKEFVNSGIEFLSAIGAAIGGFVGGIVGGVAEGLSYRLPSIGTNLSAFANNAKDFFTTMKSMHSTSLSAVSAVADAILALTKSEVLDGVSKLFGSDHSIKEFGEQLVEFADPFVEFSNKMADVQDWDVVEKAGMAAESIARFAKGLPLKGGLLGKVIGERDNLTAFGQMLIDFGPNLVEYANIVADLDADAVESSANAATMLSDLAGSLTKHGGWLQKVTGETTSLADFGKDLHKFAPYLVLYAKIVKDITKEQVEGSANAAAILIDLSKDTVKTGGVIQWFKGENQSLSEFGEQLVEFGRGLADYADTIKDVKPYHVKKSAEGVEALIGLAVAFSEANTGVLDLGDFGSKLEVLGSYYASFYGYINRTIPEKVNDMVTLLESLATVASSQNGGNLEKLASALADLSTVTLDSFIESFTGATEQLEQIGGDITTSLVRGLATAAINPLTEEVIDNAGKYVLDTFTNGLVFDDADITSVAFGIIVALDKELKDQGDIMESAAAGVIKDFTDALVKGIEEVKKAGIQIATALKENLDTFGEDFEQVGADLVEDICIGILKNKDKANEAGAELLTFGENVTEYAKMIDSVNSDNVIDSGKGIQALLGLAMAFSEANTGGIMDLGDFGEKIKILGGYYSSFYQSVSGTTADVITEAIGVLEKLAGVASSTDATSFETFATALSSLSELSFDTFKTSFDGVSEEIKGIGESLVTSLIEGITTAASNTISSSLISGSGKSLAQDFVTSILPQDSDVTSTAFGIILALSRKLKSNKSLMESAARDVMNAFDSEVLEEVKGEHAFDGVTSGLTDLGKGMVDAISSGIANEALNSLTVSLLKDAAKVLIGAFIEGLDPDDTELTAHAFGVVLKFERKLKVNDSLMTSAATYIMNSFTAGIDDHAIDVVSKAGSIMSVFTNKLSSYSDDMWSVGSDIVNGLCKGMRDNSYKVRAQAEALGETAKNATKKAVDSHSPSKEFAKIGLYCVQGFVKGIVDNTKMLDKVVTKTFGNRLIAIAKAQVTTFAKVYKSNGVKNTANAAQKSIRALGTELYHQSDAYKETKQQLKDYNKELKKLNKEQAELKKKGKSTKDIAKKIKEVNKNITDAQKQAAKDSMQVFNDYYNGIRDQAKEFVDIFSSNIDSQIDLFQKFEKGERMTSKNIIRNMKSQIDGVTEWKNNLTKLGKMGIADGLLKKLEEMGPSGSSYIKAFLKMTSAQIKEANSLFQKEQQIANTNLLNDMKSKLTDVKNWAANVSALAAKGLNRGILQKLIEMGPDGFEYVSAFMSMSAKEIKNLNKIYANTLTVPKTVANEIVSAYAYAGTDAAKGFAKGLTKGEPSAINAAVKLANNALAAAKKRLGIKSPSKEFAKVGDFAGQGFINALYSYAERSYEAGSTIADSAESGLNDAIQRITDIIAGNVDEQPTITPQLDLTNVYDGIGELDALFGGTNSIFATNSVRNARLAQTDISGSGQDAQMSGAGNTVYNFNQYNSSPKALSRLDIYRQTKNQFAMMKGVANA